MVDYGKVKHSARPILNMTYKVLSLKWRPQSFKDIIGQDHVSKTLLIPLNLIELGKAIFLQVQGVWEDYNRKNSCDGIKFRINLPVEFDPIPQFQRKLLAVDLWM